MLQHAVNQRYQILDMIGQGAMGKVFRALDRLSGSVVALKQVTVDAHSLHFSSLRDEAQDVRLALAHEFKTLASLRHPNIVSVMDYGFDAQQQPFFTMTFLEGAQTIIEAGRDRGADVQYRLLMQLLQALFYLHRRGILHRDIKPANVLVVNEQVKVLDFGLSIALNESGGTSGTLAYMAPEVIQGQPASEASDLYSLGVIAFELFSGKHPFRLDSPDLLINDVLNTVPDFSAIRQAEPLIAFVSQLLSKLSAARPRDAGKALAEYSAATGQQLPTETVVTRESFLQAAQFVGREGELAQLSEALLHGMNGQGGLLLVGGESGIGKSRLLDELRILALVEGARVLSGQSVSEGRTPYLIWRDVLRQLCLQSELSDLEKSILKAVVPDIGALWRSVVSDPPELEPQATHERLVQTICAIFSRQQQPIVVILEDLQWAGNENITILKRLALQASQARLLLVGSFRSDERPELPLDFSDAKLVSLQRLPKDRVVELSVSILGKLMGNNPALVDYLVNETEGNIFFMIEVLRTLAEQSGQLARIGSLPLPDHVFSGGMKSVVQRRLARVPNWAQPLLQLAAIAGRQLDPVLLKGVQPQIDIESWLLACADASVLDAYETGWRFSHDKLREGVIADLLPERQQDLHEQVASGIEQCYPNDAAQAAALADHWAEAGNINKEAHYAALAGQQAIRTGATKQAINYLERADTLALQVKTALTHHVEIRFLLSSAYNALGLLTDTRRQLERTLNLGGFPVPTGEKQFKVQIFPHLLGQAWHRILFDVLRRRQHSHPQAELLGWCSRAAELMTQMAYFFHDKNAGFYFALEQLQLAEQAGPAYRHLQARGYATMMAGMGAVPFHQAARHYQRLMSDASRSSTDSYMQFWTKMAPGMYMAGRGQWAEAQEQLKISSRLADEMGDTRHWRESQSFLGCIHCHTGNWADGEQLWQNLYAASVATADITFLVISLTSRVSLAFWKGDQQPGEDLLLLRGYAETLQVAMADSASANLLNIVLGMFMQASIRQGQPEGAEPYVARFLAIPRVETTANFANALFHSIVAEATMTLFETDNSEAHQRAAQKTLDSIRIWGRTFDCAKPFALLYDGWLAWVEGKPGRAVRLGQQAIVCAQRVQVPYAEGLAHYHLGRHLSPGDSRRLEHLQQAETLFERLGAAYDLDRTRRTLLQLQAD